MTKLPLALLTLSLLAACASTPPVPDAKSVVIANEAKTSMVDFRDLREYPGNVTCGSYQVTSKWGESDGFKPFVVKGENLLPRATREDIAIYCNEDPRASFETIYGIIPSDKSNLALKQFTADFGAIDAALADFKKDFKRYPLPEEGLASLSDKTLQQSAPGTETRRYLDSVPRDFWGRDYLYKPSPWGGLRQTYELVTLGANASAGGTGENADISSTLLPYLEHLDSL